MRQTVKVQYSFLSIGAVSTIQFPEVSLIPDTPPPLLTPYLCCPGNLLMTQQLVTISSDLLRSSLLAPEPRSWLLGLGFRWHCRQCLACCWLDRQCCEGGGGSVLCCCGWCGHCNHQLVVLPGSARHCQQLPTYATHSVCSPSLHTRRGLTLLHTQAWGYRYLTFQIFE